MPDKEIVHTAEVPPVQTGWVDTLKERGRHIMERLYESRSLLLDMILYGGLGFLSGFILRKYAHYVAFLVLVIVGLVIICI